jgi:hypothetical protein
MSASKPAATAAQLADIQTALTKQQDYIDQLLDAMNKASTLDQALALVGPFKDANALKEQLVFIQSTPSLNALKAHIPDIKAAAATLENQKAKIDAAVKAINTAATVLADIAAVAGAIAEL